MGNKESRSNKANKKRNLIYAYSYYMKDGGIYIMAIVDDEPYADITINLSSYGLHIADNQVVVPTYKLDEDIFFSFVDDLAERIVTRIGYGPFDAYGDVVELKKDWKDKAVLLEDYYQAKYGE